MLNHPPSKIQEICCDATSANIPETLKFTYKSSYHNLPHKGRVHVDFTLHIRSDTIQVFGVWRCRINFWLAENADSITDEMGFEYYKDGFNRALVEAGKFIGAKYKVATILNPPTHEELMEKWKALKAKENN